MTNKLRAPIKELLDASLDELRVQRMWRGMQQRPVRSAPRGWLLAGVAAALLFAVFGILHTPDAGPLAARSGSTLTFDRPSTVLSDGSQIQLAAGTHLELLENSGQSFAVRLQHGRAHFEVTPGGPRRWRMECGLATVAVIGTALTIERGDSSLRVEVAHGIVEVRGERVPGGLRRLTAGQSLSIDADSLKLAANSGTDRQPRSAAPRVAESSASRIAARPPQPQPTAAAGNAPMLATTPGAVAQREKLETRAALAQHDGPAARASENSSAAAARSSAHVHGKVQGYEGDWAERQLGEADRARQLGAQDRALAILERLLREQPGTSQAGIAAFTLARMQMDHDPRAAVDALRTSLAAATPESLREDALARLVEAYARSGNAALARSTAAEYRRKFPSGRLTAEVERWAAKP
ncbi:MAG TPA: FecR family protein [Polyangiales bacterium]|nr:FecR family protein [Polyangiales bacterium]